MLIQYSEMIYSYPSKSYYLTISASRSVARSSINQIVSKPKCPKITVQSGLYILSINVQTILHFQRPKK